MFLIRCNVFLGMTLILLLQLYPVVQARLGDHHDSNEKPSRHQPFSSLQSATLMQGASPPTEIDRMLMCTVNEHCYGRNEQCISGSCECRSGFQRLSSLRCTRIDDVLLANAQRDEIWKIWNNILSFFLILKNPIDQQKQVMAQVTVLDVVGFLP